MVGFLAVGAGVYIFSLLIFRVFLMRSVEAYVSTEMLGFSDLLPGAIANAKTFVLTVLKAGPKWWVALYAVIGAGFLWVCVRGCRQKKWLAVLGCLASAAAGLVLSFGVFLVLEKATFGPRYVYGFGVFVTVVLLVSAQFMKRKIGLAPAYVLCYLWVVFAMIYGNALAAQQNYTRFRVEIALADMAELFPEMESSMLRMGVEGGIGYAPAVGRVVRQYPVLGNMLVPSFQEGNFYGMIPLLADGWGDEDGYDDSLDKAEMVMLKDTYYHTIYGDGDAGVLIYLKDRV